MEKTGLDQAETGSITIQQGTTDPLKTAKGKRVGADIRRNQHRP